MALLRNLFFLFSLTVLAVASTVISIFNYDPYQAGRTIFVNFYVSFFMALAGIVAIALYFIKSRVSKEKTIYNHFWPSVRQASLFSLAATAALFLASMHILDWLTGISLLIVTALLELFFQTKKTKVK
ncbi:MAG: hypothetical protein WCI57_01250 [Candidatus Berkelbacteria bacterium]